MIPLYKLRKEGIKKEMYLFSSDDNKLLNGLMGDTSLKPNEPKMTLDEWINGNKDVHISGWINQIKQLTFFGKIKRWFKI